MVSFILNSLTVLGTVIFILFVIFVLPYILKFIWIWMQMMFEK